MKTTKLFETLLGSGMFAFLVCASFGTAMAQDWTTRTSDPNPKLSAASGEISGIIYVYGYDTSGGSPGAPRLSIYNPATDGWTAGASPSLTRSFVSSGIINGKMYVVGGCVSQDCNARVTNVLEIYDPVHDLWSKGASMVTPRWGAAAGVIAGKLYVTGGTLSCGSCRPASTTEVYDPTMDSWAAGASIPTSRELTVSGVVNGLWYIIGGYERDTAANVGIVSIYDPTANSWSTGALMPTVRQGAAGGVLNGDIFVVGGGNGPLLTTNESYDPPTNTWTEREPMTTARQWSAGSVVNSNLYVMDGYNAGPLGTNEEYTHYATQVQPPINADGSSVFKASRGVVPVQFTLTADGVGVCTLPNATISLSRTSGGTLGAIDETVYTMAADSGSNFRVSGCQYIYNLGSKSLGTGTYRVDLSIGGGVVGSAMFGLQ